MRSREIQQFLASITKRPLSEIDQRCRILRDEDKIVSGPRGHSAPHMTVDEAGLHVLCMAARRPKDALKVAERLLLKCRITSTVSDDKPEGWEMITAGAMLFGIMTRSGIWTGHATSVELGDDGSFAWLNMHVGDKFGRILFTDDEEYAGGRHYADFDARHAGNRFVIGREHLEHIGRCVENDQQNSEAENGL